MGKRFGFGFLASWFRRKVVDPLHQILRRGAEPKQLAFSAALGVTLGLFPICDGLLLNYMDTHLIFGVWSLSSVSSFNSLLGVTVFLCGLVIALLGSRCHAPTVMLSNFIATPIELSLMIPFLRLGEFVTGGPHFPLSSDALKKVFTGQASWEVLQSILHAVLGWVVAAPFILGVLYVLCLPCFKMLVHKFSGVPSSPKKPLSSPVSAVSSPRKSLNSPTEVRLKVRDV